MFVRGLVCALEATPNGVTVGSGTLQRAVGLVPKILRPEGVRGSASEHQSRIRRRWLIADLQWVEQMDKMRGVW